jgi:hypothetical protein
MTGAASTFSEGDVAHGEVTSCARRGRIFATHEQSSAWLSLPFQKLMIKQTTSNNAGQSYRSEFLAGG